MEYAEKFSRVGLERSIGMTAVCTKGDLAATVRERVSQCRAELSIAEGTLTDFLLKLAQALLIPSDKADIESGTSELLGESFADPRGTASDYRPTVLFGSESLELS